MKPDPLEGRRIVAAQHLLRSRTRKATYRLHGSVLSGPPVVDGHAMRGAVFTDRDVIDAQLRGEDVRVGEGSLYERQYTVLPCGHAHRTAATAARCKG